MPLSKKIKKEEKEKVGNDYRSQAKMKRKSGKESNLPRKKGKKLINVH